MIHTQSSSVTIASIGTGHDHGLLAPYVFDQARQAVRARRGAAADETGRCDSLLYNMLPMTMYFEVRKYTHSQFLSLVQRPAAACADRAGGLRRGCDCWPKVLLVEIK